MDIEAFLLKRKQLQQEIDSIRESAPAASAPVLVAVRVAQAVFKGNRWLNAPFRRKASFLQSVLISLGFKLMKSFLMPYLR